MPLDTPGGRSSRSAQRRRVAWLLAGLGLGALGLVTLGRSSPVAAGVPPADSGRPEAPGLRRLGTAAMDGLLGLSSRIGFHSGYVALFAREGRVVHATTSGLADRESGRPMAADTRFRLASMSKPITAAAALLLVEEGRLELDEPVAGRIPAAAGLRVATSREAGADGRIPTAPVERPLTVRDLLTFRAGIGDGEDPSDLGRVWAERDLYAGRGSLAERVDRILTAPLYETPGTVWRYGWAYDVLARVVEVAAGEPYDRFLQKRIFTPLGMASTGFVRDLRSDPGLATLYTQDEDRSLVPVSAPPGEERDWTPGGSGLVSTAGDFMRFALMLWNQGRYDGVQVLSPESVARMRQPAVLSGVLEDRGIEGLGWGMGVAVVVDSGATPQIDRDGDFWWSGLYGTTFFVSPSTDLAGVVLAQNLPAPHSPLPYPVFLAQTFAFWGR